MKIACTIITIDRSPKTNYLPTTLEYLIQSGLCSDERFSLDILHAGVNRLNLDQQRLSQSGATLHTIDEMIPVNAAVATALAKAATRNADFVLFFEDDVQVTPDFPDFVCSQLEQTKNSPLIDFATYYQEIVDAYFQGERFINMDSKGFYGVQCFAMPRLMAKRFSDYVFANIPTKIGYADTWFNDWLTYENLNTMVASSVPSAIQHLGIDSSFEHNYILTPGFKDDLERFVPLATKDYLPLELRSGGFALRSTRSKNQVDLNLTAQFIYSMCDGENCLIDIQNALAEQTQIDRYELNQQIRQCIASLVELDAVEYQAPL